MVLSQGLIIGVPENGGSLRAITDMKRTNDCVLHILTGQSSNGQRETDTINTQTCDWESGDGRGTQLGHTDRKRREEN